MKYLIFLLLSCELCQPVFARHIKGGWIGYEYQGNGATAGTYSYKVTAYLFISCTENNRTTQVYLGVFDGGTNASILSKVVTPNSSSMITKGSYDPCLSNPPTICYNVFTYTTTVDLPYNTGGYTLAIQDANRSNNIINIANSGSSGITFTATIPGIINSADYRSNNSPSFLFKDTAIICYNAPFTYQFSATDVDGDSLSYAFGDGLNVNNAGGNTSSNPPAAPPYPSVTYLAGFTGATPLGGGVTIDPVSGMISGTAPATTGEYVLAVYVSEWRRGVRISTIKKELQINVTNCSLTGAALNPSYINCNDFSFTFQNESTAATITSYAWDFGVPNTNADTSTKPVATYVYPDTGTYNLKLRVGNAGGCKDSVSSVVKVYPGFTPNFTTTGSCFESPFNFTDATVVKYGTVISWAWNFGDASGTTDTSGISNPSYKYPASGTRPVILQVTSSKGCEASITKNVVANDKPVITMPFRDTLICSVDTLPLLSSAVGVFSWSPNYNIVRPGTPNPLVFPKTTTTYKLTVTDGGCINSDSIKVNVLDFIKVDAGNDTSICLTDTAILRPVSQALGYSWTPAATLVGADTKNPKAVPAGTITYYVTANLGKCQDRDSVTVRVSPYPKADAGTPVTICYGDKTQLNGIITGAGFSWSPEASLTNAKTLSPVAGPLTTTNYVLTVRDSFYCPKPVRDTVTITVTPKVLVDAGQDTSAVMGQPLQLSATGAQRFVWTPTTGMDNPDIANPIIRLQVFTDSVRYVVTSYTADGCHGSDDILVRFFKTGPDIFIPNGFTPNGDGKNDVLRPVLVGIRSLEYFRVYNRYGQLIFATSQTGKGWDGRINGELQPTNSYIYMAAATDYLGRPVLKKGTSLLIR